MHQDEFNQLCPPNSSDDLCLLFCLYATSMPLSYVPGRGIVLHYLNLFAMWVVGLVCCNLTVVGLLGLIAWCSWDYAGRSDILAVFRPGHCSYFSRQRANRRENHVSPPPPTPIPSCRVSKFSCGGDSHAGTCTSYSILQ